MSEIIYSTGIDIGTTTTHLIVSKLQKPVYDALAKVMPTTMDMAKPMIAKAVAIIAAIIVIIVLLAKFL